MKRLVLALLLSTTLALAGKSVAGADSGTDAARTPIAAWGFVTLGFPASSLRLNVGDPLRVYASADGTTRAARYWIPGSNATYYLVLERRGYIAGFHAFTTEQTVDKVYDTVPPDPSGVRLGATQAQLKAIHPGFRESFGTDFHRHYSGNVANATVTYELLGDRVRAFDWRVDVPETPVLPPLAAPAGDSPADAILDVQSGETPGTHWEYLYLAFQQCDRVPDGPSWKTQRQSLVQSKGRAYDVLHAVCPSTNAERDFYFDITPYFGKM